MYPREQRRLNRKKTVFIPADARKREKPVFIPVCGRRVMMYISFHLLYTHEKVPRRI